MIGKAHRYALRLHHKGKRLGLKDLIGKAYTDIANVKYTALSVPCEGVVIGRAIGSLMAAGYDWEVANEIVSQWLTLDNLTQWADLVKDGNYDSGEPRKFQGETIR
jgi:hypothetical protein